MKRILAFIFSLIFISSCITPKVYNELFAEHEKAQKDLLSNEQIILNLRENLQKFESSVNKLESLVKNLQADSSILNQEFLTSQNKYNELSTTYDLLTSKSSRFMAEKAKETKDLLEKLEIAQNELFAKEDQLNKSTTSLKLQEDALEKSQKELEYRSSRVAELEAIINRKDSMVTALKKNISKALIGLEGDGLTIEQRSGKVYIS